MNDVEKEEQRKRLIKIGIYVGVFVLAFIILKIESLTSSKNNDRDNDKQVTSDKIEVVDNILKISQNSYEENVFLTMDDDALTLEFQKTDNIIVGSKKYHGETITFINKDSQYYKVDEESQSLVPLTDFVDFNYDKTFMELSNIKLLLNKSNSPVVSDDKVSYKYTLKDILPIYNNYNSTTYIDLGKGNITLDIYYKDKSLDYILIYTTDLYNKINDKELNQVLYKIFIKQADAEDTTWLENLLK